MTMPSDWWLPAAISREAAAYDAQFLRTLIAAAIIFFAVQIALIAVVWYFRAGKNSEAVPREREHTRLELVWVSATAFLFWGLLALGIRVWAGVQFSAAAPDAEVIEVLAQQFAWNFRYPGADGKFGRTEIKYIDDAAGNPFGLDERDPRAKDDIVAGTLRIPAGRQVKLMLMARDVIHSFFVRELRVKQDLVPGMTIPMHFVADKPGTYEVPCTELCGLGHSQMRTRMIVMPPAEYERWKREQAH
jgi:cytochrome c oxidase subunit 2